MFMIKLVRTHGCLEPATLEHSVNRIDVCAMIIELIEIQFIEERIVENVAMGEVVEIRKRVETMESSSL